MGILSCLAPGQSRELGALERVTITVLGVACTAMMLPIVLGVEVERNLVMYLFLAAMMTIAFLTTTGGVYRPLGRSWFAWGLSALTWASCLYFIAMHSQHELRWPMVSPLSAYDIAAAVVLILLVLEATRRTIGMTLVTMVGLFLAYALWGHHLEGSFSHRQLTFTENLDHLIFTTNGLLGPAMAVATYLVFIFVIFGAVLERMGGGDFFFDLSTALVGQQVGGPAKVAVISSGLYGTISGSPTADVVTTGTFTIPVMIAAGLQPRLCGRHRGRRIDRRIDHAAGDGHGRVPDGRLHEHRLCRHRHRVDLHGSALLSTACSSPRIAARSSTISARSRRTRSSRCGAVLRRQLVSSSCRSRCWSGSSSRPDRPTYGAGFAILATVVIAVAAHALFAAPRAAV